MRKHTNNLKYYREHPNTESIITLKTYFESKLDNKKNDSADGKIFEEYRKILKKLNRSKITQTALAEYMGVERGTYTTWENQKEISSMQISIKQLVRLCELFLVSPDAMLGYTMFSSSANELIGNELGLTDSAINGIRDIVNFSNDFINFYGQAYNSGFDLTFHGTNITYLNFLLSSEVFKTMLQDFADYVFPDFSVPVHYDEAKKEFVYQKDDSLHEQSEKQYIYLASREDNPNDCVPIQIDADFLERVALERMHKKLVMLKQLYISEFEMRNKVLDQLIEDSKKRDSTTK